MGIYEKNNCRILGKGQWISNDDIKSGLNNNDLIIGGTGSGKTGGYVIPNIRQANGNMVITDTKSILYKKFPLDFKLPSDTAESRLYKQAGNSVCVEVIHRIAENIISAMN